MDAKSYGKAIVYITRICLSSVTTRMSHWTFVPSNKKVRSPGERLGQVCLHGWVLGIILASQAEPQWSFLHRNKTPYTAILNHPQLSTSTPYFTFILLSPTTLSLTFKMANEVSNSPHLLRKLLSCTSSSDLCFCCAL